MKKDDSEKKDSQEKLSLDAALDVTRLIFGAKEPQDGLNEPGRKEEKPGMDSFFKKFTKKMEEIKKREELQILDSLEYPGGKRVH